MTTALPEDRNRLRWRCRRGLLELDMILLPFLDQGYESLGPAEQAAFHRLLQFPDSRLLGWFQDPASCPDEELREVIKKI